ATAVGQEHRAGDYLALVAGDEDLEGARTVVAPQLPVEAARRRRGAALPAEDLLDHHVVLRHERRLLGEAHVHARLLGPPDGGAAFTLEAVPDVPLGLALQVEKHGSVRLDLVPESAERLFG